MLPADKMTVSAPKTSVPLAADNRDEFSPTTKDLLAKRAGYMCAFPGCRRLTVGPSEDRATQTTMVGVAAHITAASARGPRYDASLSSEERYSERNGIWTCQTHGKLIDDNPSVHTVEEIARWKKQHEEWVFARVSNADNHLTDGISRIRLKQVGPFDERVDVKLGRHNVVYGPNGGYPSRNRIAEIVRQDLLASSQELRLHQEIGRRHRFCKEGRTAPGPGTSKARLSIGHAAQEGFEIGVEAIQHRLVQHVGNDDTAITTQHFNDLVDCCARRQCDD